MVLIEVMRGRVIDVEQDGMEPLGRVRGVERRLAGISEGHFEKVPVHELAARIGVQFGSQRDALLLMPLNDGLQKINDPKRSYGTVLQGCLGGVAEAESTDHHIEWAIWKSFFCCGQSQVRERDLHGGEQTRHEVFAIQDDLDNLEVVERQDSAPPENQFAKLSLTVVKFFVERSGCHEW